MTTVQLYRLSGLALLVGAVLATIQSVLSGVLFPDTNNAAAATNPLNILLGVVGLVGAILVLLGLPGMYTRSAREGGSLWLIGVVLIAITAMLFGIFFGLMGVLVFPVLATRAPDLNGPSSSGLLSTILNIISSLPLFIVVGYAGYLLWSGRVTLAEAAGRAVAPQPA